MNVPWHLIDGYLDDCLGEQEVLQLQQWLAQDREHVKTLIRAAHDHACIPISLTLAACSVAARLGGVEFTDCSGSREPDKPASLEPPIPNVASVPERSTRLREGKRQARGLFPGFGWALALAACITWIVGIQFFHGRGENNEPVLTDTIGPEPVLDRSGHVRGAKTGDSLMAGDTLKTPVGGKASVGYPGEVTQVDLKENTTLKILSSASGKRLQVLAGSVGLNVARQPTGKPMIIVTPQIEVRVVGTRFNVQASPKTARVSVLDGKVQLVAASGGKPADVAAGFLAIVQVDGQIAVERSAKGSSTSAALDLFPSRAAEPATSMPESPTGVLSTPPAGTGAILREYWFDISGTHIADLTSSPAYPDSPSGRDYPTSFETVQGGTQHDLYGARWRGFLHAPVTGSYTFWIASDDNAELYLSADEKPEHKQRIADVPGFTFQREWTKFANQESSFIHLEAGKRCYIEVLHKEHAGGDHVAVAWQPPGSEVEVIGGKFLSPFQP